MILASVRELLSYACRDVLPLEPLDLAALTREMVSRGRRLPLSGTLIGTAMERRAVIVSDELIRETRGMPSLVQGLIAAGFHRAICVPLIHRDEALGDLTIFTRGGAGDVQSWRQP